MTELMGKFATFAMADDGATAIEYGLIGALLAVACIAAFTFFGGSLAGLFNEVDARAGDAMDNAGV